MVTKWVGSQRRLWHGDVGWRRRGAHGRESSTVGLGPLPDGPSKSVYFRLPLATYNWVKGLSKGRNPSVSHVTAWAVKMGHEYWTVLQGVSDRIDKIAQEEGLNFPRLVGTLLRLGLESYERQRAESGSKASASRTADR